MNSPDGGYVRPPIVEAVVELRFASEIALEVAVRAASRLSDRYPTSLSDYQVIGQIEAGGASTVRQREIARRLVSEDQADTLIVGVGNIIFSRSAPYPGWDAFISRVRDETDALLPKLTGARINQIGLRYINRIDVVSKADISFTPGQYVRFIPLLPNGSVVGGFTMQVEMPTSVEGRQIRLATATVESPVPNAFGLLVDIDVIHHVATGISKNHVWDMLGEMRVMKNQFFEAAITDAARELFA